jgi:hypothetical protein
MSSLGATWLLHTYCVAAEGSPSARLQLLPARLRAAPNALTYATPHTVTVHRRVIQEELPPLTELISERHFEQKVSYKPGSYTQYLQSYVRIWKRTTVKCAWPLPT